MAPIFLAPSTNSPSVIWELVKALVRGLERWAAYTSAGTERERQYWELKSAFEHLARGIPYNFMGLAYLERLNHADPAVLQAALSTFGYTSREVAEWRESYGHLPPIEVKERSGL